MTSIPDGAFGDRVRQHLEMDKVAWLTTVGSSGTPQPNPVWFLWEQPATVLVYNRPDAKRLGHIERNTHVSLNFAGNGRGGDIVVITGIARVASGREAPNENAAYLAKYRADAIRVSGDPEAFAQAYSVPLEIEIRRVRGH